MRILKIAWATFALLALAAAPAVASQRPAYERTYLRSYAELVQRHGVHSVGCNLVTNKYHNRCHRKATRHAVMKSIATIHRMLYVPPPPKRVVSAPTPTASAATAARTTSNAPNTASGSGYVPPGGPGAGTLAAIRACESGGNYSTNTGNGFYGAYQFTQSTWNSVGGSGNPANASPAEQDKRAAMLYAQQGASPWPVCGR